MMYNITEQTEERYSISIQNDRAFRRGGCILWERA